MKRPKGVTVIAVLHFLGAAFAILLVFVVGVVKKPLSDFMPQLGELPIDPALAQAIFTAALLVSALVSVALGIGLWKLINWVRMVVLVFALLGAISNLLGVLSAAAQAKDWDMVVALVTLTYNVWAVWYLRQPHVKQAFAGAVTPATGLEPPPPADSEPPGRPPEEPPDHP